MTRPDQDSGQPAAAAPVAPPVGVLAVLAAMQDQLDDLTATVEAQQRTIDELLRARRAQTGPPAPRRGKW